MCNLGRVRGLGLVRLEHGSQERTREAVVDLRFPCSLPKTKGQSNSIIEEMENLVGKLGYLL